MTRGKRIATAVMVAAALAGVATWRLTSRTAPDVHASARAASTARFVPTPAGQHAFDHAQADVVAGQTTTTAELSARWQASSDRVARVELLQAAARIPDPHGLAFLVQIASSTDPLAAQAAAAIGGMANRRLAGELARLASSDAPTIVRANAARALGGSATSEQAIELAALVADEGAPLRVRQEAALALGRLADIETADTLADTLDTLASDRSDNAVQLRISVVQALGAVHCQAAHDALLRHRARALSSTELAFVERALGRDGQAPS